MFSVPSVGEVCNLNHFRTLIHSNFVANINNFVGHNISRIAHVSDWGIQAGKKNIFNHSSIRIMFSMAPFGLVSF